MVCPELRVARRDAAAGARAEDRLDRGTKTPTRSPRSAEPTVLPRSSRHGHDRRLETDSRSQREARRREPERFDAAGVFVLDLDGVSGRRQDIDDPRHDRGAARPLRHRGHRGRHREQGRRREGQGTRDPGGADQHRRRVPPRERHDQAGRSTRCRSTSSTSSSSRTSATSCVPPSSTWASTPR